MKARIYTLVLGLVLTALCNAAPQINSELVERLLQYEITNAYTGEKDAIIQERFPGSYVETTPKYKLRYIVLKDQQAKTQTIAFRWTGNLVNAWLDVYIKKVEDEELGVRLHKGFQIGSLEVTQRVQRFLDPEYKTYVTGHSMGGAIAVLTAARLQKRGYEVIEVASFGQPRVTDSSGAQKMLGQLNYIRVAHKWDFPSMLPPKFLGFRHFGAHLQLIGDHDYRFLIPDSSDYEVQSEELKQAEKRAWEKAQTLSRQQDNFEKLDSNDQSAVKPSSVWGPGHELTNYIHRLSMILAELKQKESKINKK